ncbi:MAG: TonB-dependent receptor [Tannerellaceae bacterium]|nr:TonB-dependent receptor [Tannerellaceae bacterium]
MLLMHLCLQAQDRKTLTISGYIYDAPSKETLIGANVYAQHTQKGTVSNNYGFYSISLPQGEVALNISYVGYQSVELRFNLSKDTVIDVSMEASVSLQEVVVEARKGVLSNVSNTQLGALSLSPAMIKSVPAIMGEVDLVKVLQQMPGVSAGTEGFSGLYVRGGNKDENLYLIDGNPVYDVNHLLGFFSTFNADAIKSTEFYKGNFPARFGGRLSSVVDVRTKDGNMQAYHGSFTLGLVSSKAQLEGPIIKDKASFNIAFRRTYLDLITTPLLWIVNAQTDNEKNHFGYSFYDLNAKLNYKFSDRSRMYLNWYSGEDAFKVRQEWTYDYEQTAMRSENGVRWNWGNQLTSLNWNYIFDSRLFANMSAIYSRFHSGIKLYDWQHDQTDDRSAQSRMEMNNESGIEDLGYRVDFDYMPIPHHYIRFGSNYLFHTFQPETNTTSSSSSYGEVSSGDTTRFHNNRLQAHEWAVYAEDDIELTPWLRTNIGLNFSLFNVEHKTYTSLQPRLSARFLLHENLSFKASYARMNQYVHLLSSSAISLPTDLWVPVTKNIRPMISNQLSAGLFFKLQQTYDISLEAYYKKMSHVIDYRDGVSLFSSSAAWQERVAEGEGEAYGLELLVQRTAGKLTGWAGYGLSWADRQFPGGEINGGRKFWAKYDNRHKINLVLSYKLNDKIEINGSWTYYSGNRMTVAFEQYEQPPLIPGGQSSVETYFRDRNNYRMSDYHRLDLGFNFYRPKKKGRMGIWNLSLYNAYSRLNPMMAMPRHEFTEDEQGHTIQKAKMREYSLFPIIPSFSYTYKF